MARLYPKPGSNPEDETGTAIPPGGIDPPRLTPFYAGMLMRGDLTTYKPAVTLGVPAQGATLGTSDRVDVTSVSILKFGAVGDGIADDTAAIQAAIDKGTSTVVVPKGTFLCGNLNLRANVCVQGAGWRSVLKFRPGSSWLLSANAGQGGTPFVADNMRNITLRDLELRGLCDELGFAEHNHLLNLNAVSDVLIENVMFRGFQGDGVYIGSSNRAHTERHNENVTLRNCFFDGINSENRNGVSIIDCTGLMIENCDFVNTTRGGTASQPGCVDFEPDANAFARVRRCTVQDCRMRGGHGAGVACLLPPQTSVATPIGPITIRNCHIEKPLGFTFFGDNANAAPPADTTADYNVTWEGNHVSGGSQAFIFIGLKGARMLNNYFGDMTAHGEFGYTTGCRDVLVHGNTFERLATAQTTGIVIRWCASLTFRDNKFSDIGHTSGSGGRAIGFLAGVSRHLRFYGNTIAAPTKKMTTFSTEVGGTVHSGTCEFTGNSADPGLGTGFSAVGSSAPIPPASGSWEIGNVVYHSAPTAGGNLGWVYTAAGWKPFGPIA